MIFNSRDQEQRSDQGWISWINLGVPSMAIWLAENQLQFERRLSGKIIYKDQLMIACIRTHLESTDLNDSDKGCQ